jgi:hypothetical protein
MEGSERAVWEARWSWVAGRREGEGQPRRRLMEDLGGIVDIALRLWAARRGLIKVINERNNVTLEKFMISNEGGRKMNFSRFIASLLALSELH